MEKRNDGLSRELEDKKSPESKTPKSKKTRPRESRNEGHRQLLAFGLFLMEMQSLPLNKKPIQL
jgi:hypothetical protein